MSPGSGELFTTKVNLGMKTPSRIEDEEATSETSVVIREEERKIFEEETRRHQRDESDGSDYVVQYEAELKKAKVHHLREEAHDGKENISRMTVEETDGRKRSRRPRHKRSKSNSTDRRRERHRSKHARH